MKYEREGDNLTLTVTCPRCKQEKSVKVTSPQYFRWTQGAMTQDAFPQLNPDERELLISGICGPCWKNLFNDNEAN